MQLPTHWIPVRAIAALLLAFLATPAPAVPAQDESPTSGQPIQIQGRVVSQLKYSIEVESRGQSYAVRLASGAPVALTLRRPFFDWEQQRVFVDPAGASPEPEAAEEAANDRKVPVRIPGGPLYLISRFRSPQQMQRVMESPEKRINYYLISPQPMADHPPTEKEPYISGRLVADAEAVQLWVGADRHPIRLGFRTATLGGYHIGDLQAGRVQVTLSGVLDPSSGEILASSVAFEPLPPQDWPAETEAAEPTTAQRRPRQD